MTTPEFIIRDGVTPPPRQRHKTGLTEAIRNLRLGQEMETTAPRTSVLAIAGRIKKPVTTRVRDGKTFVYATE